MTTTPKPPTDELAERRRVSRRVAKPQTPGTKKGRKENQPAGSTSGQKAITAKAKQSQAVQLRLAGANLTQVADTVGYHDASAARKAIMSALQQMLPEETRNELRMREIATLDRLQVANFTAALNGDDKAATIVLRCVAQRSKLLGLEAPVQLDVRVREGELVQVEYLDLLNDETMAALAPLQEEMVRLSELRAGVIDIDPDDVVEQ